MTFAFASEPAASSRSSVQHRPTQSRSIVSIPEDVLAMIFELVLSAHRSPFSTLTLSHVNQQFRIAALSNPQLWTHISGSERHPQMGLVQACLERSQDLPLTVHLNVYLDSMYGPSCDEILTATRPHSHRWRTVYIRFIHIPHGPPDFSVGFVGAVKGLTALQKMETPALEHLELDNDMWILEEELDFFATWKTGLLRSLVAVHGFPFKLSNLQSISTLDITLSFHTTDFHALLALLSKMSSLTDLAIFFDNHQRDYSLSNPVFQNISLGSVQRLRISIAQNRPHDDPSENLETALYSALSFPNARELSITFVGEPLVLSDSPAQIPLHEEVHRLFADWNDLDKLAKRPRQFPLVSCLSVNIICPNQQIDVGSPGLGIGVAALVLPLNIFPALKELRVKSTTLLEFGVYNIEEYEQPALRRIEVDAPRLTSSSTRRDASPPEPPLMKWLRALAGTLVAQGKWHEFEEVVLTERFLGVSPGGKDIRRWEVRNVLSRDTLTSVDGSAVLDNEKRQVDRVGSISFGRPHNPSSQGTILQSLAGKFANMFAGAAKTPSK